MNFLRSTFGRTYPHQQFQYRARYSGKADLIEEKMKTFGRKRYFLSDKYILPGSLKDAPIAYRHAASGSSMKRTWILLLLMSFVACTAFAETSNPVLILLATVALFFLLILFIREKNSI